MYNNETLSPLIQKDPLPLPSMTPNKTGVH